MQQITHPSRLNSTCTGDDNNPTLTSEKTLMKENITQLLTDVNMLKSSFVKTQETLNGVTDSMKKDISEIKLELEECKLKCTKTINVDKYPKAAQSSRLADKLSHIGWMLSKLDNSRILLEQKTHELEQSISYNSLGIGELKDREAAGNIAIKGQIRDIREKVEEASTSVHPKDSSDANKVYMGVAKRHSALEKRAEEPKSSTIENAFNVFSNHVSSKIDKLCTVVEQSIVYKPTASVNGGLLRDPSGKFTRLSPNNIEASYQNQPSLANPSVTSTITTEGVQPDRRKSFVASRWDPGSGTSTDFNVTNEQDVKFRSDNINFSDAPNIDKNSLAAPSETVGFTEMDKNENHYSRPIPVVNSSGKPD